jgi:hypothetical protein
MGLDQGHTARTGGFRWRNGGGQPAFRGCRALYRYRTGIPWRDLPNDLGSWKNIHRRFSRWAKRGVWAAILGVLAQDADNEYAMIDSTVVRAHQHSAGARKVDADQEKQRRPQHQDPRGPHAKCSKHRV